MTTSRKTEILAKLAAHPGAIAEEVGATPIEMVNLESISAVMRVGTRKTGKRGRPPVEWAIPGEDGEAMARDTSPVKGAPKLIESAHVRDRITSDENRALDYIEAVFDGKYGQRELQDYRVLAERYEQIVATAERKAARRV